MYNEDLKRKFIGYYTKYGEVNLRCKEIFELFAPYEEEWKADLCTKSEEEIENVVGKLGLGTRADTRRYKIAPLNEYRKWCIKKNVEGAVFNRPVKTYGISIKDIAAIRKKTVAKPRQLSEFLDAVFEKTEENTNDNTYKCYLWIAYCGCLRKDAAVSITTNDVDLKNMIFYANGKEYKIYKEAIDVFRSCVESSMFKYKHPNYDDRIRSRVDGNLLLRGIRAQPSYEKFAMIIYRKNRDAIAKGKTDKMLTYNNIWLSGVFYRKLQKEFLTKEDAEFADVARMFLSEVTGRLDFTDALTIKELKIKMNNYKNDYARWKTALKDELFN